MLAFSKRSCANVGSSRFLLRSLNMSPANENSLSTDAELGKGTLYLKNICFILGNLSKDLYKVLVSDRYCSSSISEGGGDSVATLAATIPKKLDSPPPISSSTFSGALFFIPFKCLVIKFLTLCWTCENLNSYSFNIDIYIEYN